MICINDRIIVVGGINKSLNITNECEMYNIEEDYWERIGDLSEGVMNATLCQIREHFVVKFGGKASQNDLSNTIEILDIRINEWSIINYLCDTQIIFPSNSCATEISDGVVLLFGGIYNAETKTDKIYQIQFNVSNDI